MQALLALAQAAAEGQRDGECQAVNTGVPSGILAEGPKLKGSDPIIAYGVGRKLFICLWPHCWKLALKRRLS